MRAWLEGRRTPLLVRVWRGEHHILVTFLLWGFAVNKAIFALYAWAGGWGGDPVAPWALRPLFWLSWAHMVWWSVAVWRSSTRVAPTWRVLARIAMLFGWINAARFVAGAG